MSEHINETLIPSIINEMKDYIVFLDNKTRVVYANTAFKERFKFHKHTNQLLGDIMGCKHHILSGKPCGSGQACKACITNHTVRKVSESFVPTDWFSHMTIIEDGREKSLNLENRLVHYELSGKVFFMLTMKDISDSVIKEQMQRIFFHDILNTANGLYNVLRILKMTTNESIDDLDSVEKYVTDIIDEIQYQKDIVSVESGVTDKEIVEIDVKDLIESNVKQFIKQDQYKAIEVELELEQKIIFSHPTVLRRIIINLIKNAIEAHVIDAAITLKGYSLGHRYFIEVTNAEFIPIDIQKNLFTKGYSTKGSGRGLGIYGARLLLREMLDGDIKFKSDQDGTVFTVII